MRCALIGDPAGHSLSPALHRAAYLELGLDWTYDAIPVAPSDLDAFVAGLGDTAVGEQQWRGLSVTMPHKEAILAHGRVSDLAQLVGAANTLIVTPGESHALYNTDVSGVQEACRRRDVPHARSATVIGNGATARSAVVALAGLGLQRLTVLARNPERAAHLSQLAETLHVSCQVHQLAGATATGDLMVSTVPSKGVDEDCDRLVGEVPVIFDAIYDPWPTPLARVGLADGRTVISGLDLLCGQAVHQINLMTGGSVGFDGLLIAGQAELRARGKL